MKKTYEIPVTTLVQIEVECRKRLIIRADSPEEALKILKQSNLIGEVDLKASELPLKLKFSKEESDIADDIGEIYNSVELAPAEKIRIVTVPDELNSPSALKQYFKEDE